MKYYCFLFLFGMLFLFFSCHDDSPKFKIDTNTGKQHYKSGDTISLEVISQKNINIDSIIYYFDNKIIANIHGSNKLEYTPKNEKFGKKSIKALVYFRGKTEEVNTTIEMVSSIEPKLLQYQIINTYPHDIGAYTQGLEFSKGILYESTGSYGKSSVRKIEAKTGKILQQIKLEDQFFGEGLTILNDKLYQLTWREKKGFVYDPQTLEKIEEFSFFKAIEGWGLCNDGKNLYFSDGTETIYILDPQNMQPIDYINVYTTKTKIPRINEMEWIEEKIFANIYMQNAIAVINPKNGSVEGVIDLSNLRTKVTQHKELDVLNGIAYNPQTKTIFVTGKNWDKMFEIVLELE